MNKRKTSPFTSEGIESLAKNRPIVYKIEDNKGNNLYTGVAKRGRVEERLKEHLLTGPDPVKGGAKIHIIQKASKKPVLTRR